MLKVYEVAQRYLNVGLENQSDEEVVVDLPVHSVKERHQTSNASKEYFQSQIDHVDSDKEHEANEDASQVVDAGVRV